MELSILCGCEIALIVFNSNKLFHYSSSDLDSTLVKYADFNEEASQSITNKEVCVTLSRNTSHSILWPSLRAVCTVHISREHYCFSALLLAHSSYLTS